MPYLLTNEYTKRKAAAAIPGSFWDPDWDAWILPDDPSPRSVAIALQLFPALVHEYPELLDIRAELTQDAAPVDYATPYWKANGAPTTGIAPRVEAEMAKRGWAWKDYGDWHQAGDLMYGRDVLKKSNGFECAWARGYGKTLFSAAMIDALGCKNTLVVAPNTAKQDTWAAELAWSLPWCEVAVLPNEAKKRDEFLERLRADDRGVSFVLVVHYEALKIVAGTQTHKPMKDEHGKPMFQPWLNPETQQVEQKPVMVKLKTAKLLKGWDKLGITWDLFVADEGHRLSNPETLQARSAHVVPATRRLLLTGSSFQNKWEELFGQAHFLFPKRYVYPRRDWGARYLDYASTGYSEICVGIQPEQLDTMRDELGRWMVLREKEPKTINNEIRVKLSENQMKAYTELSETMMTQWDDTKIKVKNGVSMLTRLRQVATGLDLLDHKLHDSSKLDAAIEEIERNWDRGDDYVVFCWYKQSAYALAKLLHERGIESYVITGDVKDSTRAASFKASRLPGHHRVLIGTIGTMGESINLQHFNHVIRIDRHFNPALNLQAVDRVDRQGQERPVYLTDILAEGTVDEFVVLPTILNKEAMRAIVFGR